MLDYILRCFHQVISANETFHPRKVVGYLPNEPAILKVCPESPGRAQISLGSNSLVEVALVNAAQPAMGVLEDLGELS